MTAKKMNGIIRVVKAPPRLPHPPAVALAKPTIGLENMTLTHAWHETKEARPMPMPIRHSRKPVASLTNIMARMGGVVRRRRSDMLFRAPITSAR